MPHPRSIVSRPLNSPRNSCGVSRSLSCDVSDCDPARQQTNYSAETLFQEGQKVLASRLGPLNLHRGSRPIPRRSGQRAAIKAPRRKRQRRFRPSTSDQESYVHGVRQWPRQSLDPCWISPASKPFPPAIRFSSWRARSLLLHLRPMRMLDARRARRRDEEGWRQACWAEARPCAFASGLEARGGAMLTEAVLTMVFWDTERPLSVCRSWLGKRVSFHQC